MFRIPVTAVHRASWHHIHCERTPSCMCIGRHRSGERTTFIGRIEPCRRYGVGRPADPVVLTPDHAAGFVVLPSDSPRGLVESLCNRWIHEVIVFSWHITTDSPCAPWNRATVALCSTELGRRHPVLHRIGPPSPCAPQNRPPPPWVPSSWWQNPSGDNETQSGAEP
jgi:hypothetical protein